MPKSHQQAQQICSHNLDFIINNSNKKLKDNKLVRKHLFAYSNNNAENIQANLLAQAGQFDNGNHTKENMDNQPRTSIRNDCFSYRSIRKTKSSRASPQKTKKQPYINKSIRTSSLKNSGVFASPIKKHNKQNKFIDLSQIMNKDKKGKKITQVILDQINNQEQMRRRKVQGDHKNQQNQNQQQNKQKEAQEKQKVKKQYFKKQLARGSKVGKQISFTTDLQGNIIYFDVNETRKQSLKKQYPPSSVNFSFEQQDQPQLHNNDYLLIKERAAKGEAFASAVLKTMNVSRISINMGNTTNIDQYSYMKRNDLFNNNHSRQVTTIPYLQMNQGTSFKQTNTNLSVSKKTSQRTYHSEMKSGFKTHAQTHRGFKNTKNNQKSCGAINNINIDPDLRQNIKGRRTQSSRPYRPKSCIPYSAKTTDRITSFNEELVSSLLE